MSSTAKPQYGSLGYPLATEQCKRPWLCPVCHGCGTVPHDFYTRIGYSTSTERERCRSCGGRGIVLA